MFEYIISTYIIAKMLVNIDLYIRERLFNEDDLQNNTINEHNEKIMNTIYNYIHDNKITRDGILTTIGEGLINFKNQNGGAITEVKLKDDKKYYYNIERIVSKNSNKYNICFINIRENNNNCLCFKYSSKKSILTLTDLNANDDCVVCQDKSHKYKIGDILMQIFLQYVKDNKDVKHITEIQLQDNSIKKCYGIGIKLKYLRTITHGEPYYAKYGFRPQTKLDYKTYKYNKELYKKGVHINSSIIKDIFKLSKELKKSVYKAYKKYIEASLSKSNDIDPAILLKRLIELENMKKPFELSNEEKSSICELVSFTVKNIYLACGYKDYEIDLWTLQLK
jgi:hypothetical protein